MSDSKEILRKSLKSLFDDLIDAETGPDRNTFGFKHRLKEIFKSLSELEPKIVDDFSELGELEVLEDYDTLDYTRGDSGMAQLIKSRIKQILIVLDNHLENVNEESKSTTQSFLVFGNTYYLQNRDLKSIFFETVESTTVMINSNVHETGMDLQFVLMTYDDYVQLDNYWKIHPSNPKNPRSPYVQIPPRPKTNELFSLRTNIIDRKFELNKNTKYAWVLDNTYSKLNSKTVTTKIKLQISVDSPLTKSNLPIIELMKNKIPLELFNDLSDANDCFLHNHNRQSAIMFRKALETAIKLKIKQTEKSDSLLVDQSDNELRLSDKLKLLVKESLISNQTKIDIEDTVKWFGDSGVHTKMDIVSSDIQHNIEPKFRKFIKELNLVT